MANAVDQDEQWLINCLNATLDTNEQVRSFAEASLTQASLQRGYGSALSRVSANEELPLGLRQLAAVLLKRFVEKHWSEDADSFEHPVVAKDEKDVICRLLLLSLDDSHRKIRTAISMAVAAVAHYDWPEDWPELLPFLIKLISDQSNMNGVHGALRCLAVISEDFDDKAVPTIVPVLFPYLHSIVSCRQIYDKSLCAKALSIVHSCTSMLSTMSGVYKEETTELMLPMLKLWMEQCSVILDYPVQSDDPGDWSLRMEVLKCLQQFIQNFHSVIEKEFMAVVGPLWQTFVSSLKVYEQSLLEGAEDSYDSDGTEKSLESYLIQLFEFLLTIVGSSKFAKAISNNIRELVYYTFGFLQITEEQVHSWSLDANQYIADDDEHSFSCRVSGVLLLEQIITLYGSEGIDAVVDAGRQRFKESQQSKAYSSKSWWRMREALLYALGSLSEQLLEAEVSGSDSLRILVEEMITADMGTGAHEFPFLCARMFSSVAKLSSMVSRGLIEHFLYASIKAIGMDVPPPVKIGACQALIQLLPEANKDILQLHILQLFSSLTDLLKQASEESLHLILETLQAAVKSGHGTLVSIEPILSPIILNTWVTHVADPFISIEAIDVLEAIKNAPGCILPLVSRVLPYIGPILSKPRQHPDGLVAGSLDLVTMLLKNAPTDVVKALFDVCFDPVVKIVLQSDDTSEMQNATECLAAFVCGAREELLAWGGDPGFTMRSLLDALSRLLDPEMESSGSFFVGNYILQLILHLPSQMMQHIRDLIGALVRRMQSCEIVGLKNSLIVVFARLVHMSAPNVGQFIDLLLTVPAEGHRNSFVYLMSEWVKLQGEILGAYQIKVTATALALLLSTKHVELTNINVQGHLKATAGITTRSKAKSAPDQWTMTPLHAKILALLADAVIEIQEQVTGGDDEDSDWEEVDAGDAETDQELFAAVSSSGPTYDHLAAMAKLYGENHKDDNEDNLLSSADPLNEINLANYLVDFFVKLYQSDTPLFEHLSKSLTESQQQAIRMVLSR